MGAMYVKICGILDPHTAEIAISSGADAIGVVMSVDSPRHASPEQAAAVASAVRQNGSAVDSVLVVRGTPADEAARTAIELGFDVLQLHGDYSHEDHRRAAAIIPRIWRATNLAAHPELTAGSYGEERLLVDGSIPGSGEPWDLGLISRADLGNDWLLAGGLDPDTVAAAIRSVSPGGVDVSSGVESSPGVKSLDRIREFITAAKRA